MVPMDLTKWVKVKGRKKELVVFLQDLPEVILSNGKTFGPVRSGHVMISTQIPEEIYGVLVERGVVKVFR